MEAMGSALFYSLTLMEEGPLAVWLLRMVVVHGRTFHNRQAVVGGHKADGHEVVLMMVAASHNHHHHHHHGDNLAWEFEDGPATWDVQRVTWVEQETWDEEA